MLPLILWRGDREHCTRLTSRGPGVSRRLPCGHFLLLLLLPASPCSTSSPPSWVAWNKIYIRIVAGILCPQTWQGAGTGHATALDLAQACHPMPFSWSGTRKGDRYLACHPCHGFNAPVSILDACAYVNARTLSGLTIAPRPGLRTTPFIRVVDVVRLELLPRPTLLPSSARHHGAGCPTWRTLIPPRKANKSKKKGRKAR